MTYLQSGDAHPFMRKFIVVDGYGHDQRTVKIINDEIDVWDALALDAQMQSPAVVIQPARQVILLQARILLHLDRMHILAFHKG